MILIRRYYLVSFEEHQNRKFTNNANLRKQDFLSEHSYISALRFMWITYRLPSGIINSFSLALFPNKETEHHWELNVYLLQVSVKFLLDIYTIIYNEFKDNLTASTVWNTGETGDIYRLL